MWVVPILLLSSFSVETNVKFERYVELAQIKQHRGSEPEEGRKGPLVHFIFVPPSGLGFECRRKGLLIDSRVSAAPRPVERADPGKSPLVLIRAKRQCVERTGRFMYEFTQSERLSTDV
jgi:hypothetical protein